MSWSLLLGIRGPSVDKQLPQDYYPLIMASERVQRRIDHLLDQTEEAIDQLDWERLNFCQSRPSCP